MYVSEHAHKKKNVGMRSTFPEASVTVMIPEFFYHSIT